MGKVGGGRVEGWSSQGGKTEGWGSLGGRVEGREVSPVTWVAALVEFPGFVLMPWQLWQEVVNLNQGWTPYSKVCVCVHGCRRKVC